MKLKSLVIALMVLFCFIGISYGTESQVPKFMTFDQESEMLKEKVGDNIFEYLKKQKMMKKQKKTFKEMGEIIQKNAPDYGYSIIWRAVEEDYKKIRGFFVVFVESKTKRGFLFRYVYPMTLFKSANV